jgi:hypothetical protein
VISVPEEIRGLLRALVADRETDRDLIRSLDRDVKRLAESYRRSKWERVAIVVVLLASIFLVSLYIVDALQRRVEFRQQLRDLACLAVKRTPAGLSETVDDLRARYDCPPYQAPAPGVGSTPAPRSTGSTARPRALPRATVTATRTPAAASVTVRVAEPPVTTTRTVVHRSTRTLVQTRTRISTVTVTAPPPCLLPLLCRTEASRHE